MYHILVLVIACLVLPHVHRIRSGRNHDKSLHLQSSMNV